MKNFKYLTLAAVSALSIGACTPTHNVRGNFLQDYQLATVEPGKDTQTDILKKLGSPTTVSAFDDKVWYYMGQKTEKRGILDPEVRGERIVAVTFTDDGLVKTIEDIDNKRLDIPYNRQETPASGNEITVMQQLLGNMGRFNKAGNP